MHNWAERLGADGARSLPAPRRLMPRHGIPVARDRLESCAERLGMTCRDDPGRAQLGPNEMRELAVLVVGVKARRPDLGGRYPGWVDLDDQRRAHERGCQDADVAMAHSALVAPPVGQRVVLRQVHHLPELIPVGYQAD